MKTFLMHENRDFDAQQPLPWNAEALVQDLGLDTLFSTMAGNDKFLDGVARTAILSDFQTDIGTILYRQTVLKDCLQNPSVVRIIYNLSADTLKRKIGIFGGHSEGPLPRSSIVQERSCRCL